MGAAPAGCGAIWPALDLPVSSLYFSFCYLGLSGAFGIPNHHGERRDGAASPASPPPRPPLPINCHAEPGRAAVLHLLSSPGARQKDGL